MFVAGPEEVVERVRAATGGRGAELVLDAVAGSGVTDPARAVADDGMLLIHGALSGEPTPYPGVGLGLPPVSMRAFLAFEVARRPERLRRAQAFIASGLRSGAFRPVVDRVFPLDEIVAAHRYLESNAQFEKVVVTVPH